MLQQPLAMLQQQLWQHLENSHGTQWNFHLGPKDRHGM
jgi:hypothetical protein